MDPTVTVPSSEVPEITHIGIRSPARRLTGRYVDVPVGRVDDEEPTGNIRLNGS